MCPEDPEPERAEIRSGLQGHANQLLFGRQGEIPPASTPRTWKVSASSSGNAGTRGKGPFRVVEGLLGLQERELVLAQNPDVVDIGLARGSLLEQCLRHLLMIGQAFQARLDEANRRLGGEYVDPRGVEVVKLESDRILVLGLGDLSASTATSIRCRLLWFRSSGWVMLTSYCVGPPAVPAKVEYSTNEESK